MNKMIETIVDFIFPPHCPECGAYVEIRGGWCESCLIKRLDIHRLPLEPKMLKHVDGAWALGNYDGAVKKLIKRLKFQKDRGTLPAIHNFVQAGIPMLPEELRQIDLLTVVPLHKRKEKERGFNQAKLIFLPFFRNNKIFVKSEYRCLLQRNRETIPQYNLSAEERKNNLKGAFSLYRNENLAGKNILLVDDIMTTGTTFYECAKVLKKADAAKVYVLALASDR